MSGIVVTDQRWAPLFSQWLSERFTGEVRLDPTTTRFIAYVLEGESEPEILTVAAFSNWQRGSVEVTLATDGSKRQKASRAFIYTCFDFAFNHCGKSRLSCHSRVDNIKSHAVQEMLGLTRVALLKDHYGEDEDAYLYGITKREWLAGPWALPPVNSTAQQEA
jgi:RimJ/RimL family protein N-acetyltransferase